MNGYLRHPHVHGDEIVFVADDDLWLVPVTGGTAARLTSDRCPVSSPRFSPDGRRIAFTSTRDGHAEAMLLDRDAGTVTRLTWFGRPGTQVRGWLPDGRVLVSSDGRQPLGRRDCVYAVPPDGSGAPERLPYGVAMDLALHPDGAVALVTPNSRDSAMWKRYRGGTAAQLWLDPAGDGDWRQVGRDTHAGMYSPCWVGDRLVFTSDLGARLPGAPDEQAQVWSVDRDGGDLRQHTHHTFDGDGPDGAHAGYVRDVTTDGARLVYHARGRLYVMEADALTSGADDASASRLLDVDLGATSTPTRLLDPTERLLQVLPDARGDASVVEWFGNAWWLTHRGGPARRVVGDEGVRVREPRVLGPTGRVVAVTDAEGEDALEVARADGLGAPRRYAAGRLGRVLHLAAAPDGGSVVAISHDGTVRLVTLPADDGPGNAAADATGAAAEAQVTELDRCDLGEPSGPVFSPDGRYLVWSAPVAPESEEHHRLVLADLRADGGPRVEPLTSGRFDDVEPVFTRDGRHLVFLSARTFDPDYGRFSFDMGFSDAVRPWLVPLRAQDPAPFGPSVDGWPVGQVQDARDEGVARPATPPTDAAADAPGQTPGGAPADGAAAGTGATAEVPEAVRIDVDGFEERIVPLPVPSADYANLRTVKDGVAWVRRAAATGVLGSRRAGVEGDAPRDRVERFGFDSRTLDVLASAESFEVSGDGERLVLRDRDDVVVVPSDHKVEDDDPARIVVDLDRMRRDADLPAMWRQMFDENGRIMRDHYWRADMDGVDWQRVLDAYRPVAARARTHDDLVDVLWETVGELNTSHAYVTPPTAAGETEHRLGRLGVDVHPVGPADEGRDAAVALAPAAVVLDAILPGESSDPLARSPLRAAGVGARPGDVIVAVDGRRLERPGDLDRLLQGAAERVVELTLLRPSAPEGDPDRLRRVVVVPLPDEEVLRYQAWVASRREYVRARSGGRVGYVHVPDMVAKGWAQLHRDIEEATRAEGVVVDVRYNRGGHTSELVVERFARKVVGWDVSRHRTGALSYPQQAPRGPVVFVANRWSGSDGDIVNAAVQELELGPVVGERTWGGVIGIDGRFDLVDGTGITQPRYSFRFTEHGWGVENHGVDPDIEVVPTPPQWEDDITGRADVQLDRAVDEVLTRLEQNPAAQPPELPEPRFRRS